MNAYQRKNQRKNYEQLTEYSDLVNLSQLDRTPNCKIRFIFVIKSRQSRSYADGSAVWRRSIKEAHFHHFRQQQNLPAKKDEKGKVELRNGHDGTMLSAKAGGRERGESAVESGAWHGLKSPDLSRAHF